MCHAPLHHVVSFKIVKPYTLWIEFDDHSTQTINFKPILAGELYEPLLQLEFFNQVKLDSEAENLVWPNGADFDPSDLHDWPQVVHEYEHTAKLRHKQQVTSG